MQSAPPSISVVTVWYACVAWLADPALRQRCGALLDADEQAAHGRFMVKHAQDAYLLAHALCRVALSDHDAAGGTPPAAWRFAPSAGGKPRVVAPHGGVSMHFNISHCRSVVAVAVCSDHPVGVDVEQADRRIDVTRLGPRVLSPREYAACMGDPAPSVHFLRHWTLKEAYLKARGEGIADDLSRIEMHVDGDARASGDPGVSDGVRQATGSHANDARDAGVRVEDTRDTANDRARDTGSGVDRTSDVAANESWHLRWVPMRICDTDCILAGAVGASAQASRFVWSDAAALLGV